MQRKSNFLSINRRDIFPKISFQRYDKQRIVRYRDLYVAQTKYHLNPDKEPEETHALLHGASSISWSYCRYLDIDWNESEELSRAGPHPAR